MTRLITSTKELLNNTSNRFVCILFEGGKRSSTLEDLSMVEALTEQTNANLKGQYCFTYPMTVCELVKNRISQLEVLSGAITLENFRIIMQSSSVQGDLKAILAQK